MVLVGGGISTAVGSPVLGVILAGAVLAASLAALVLLGPYIERRFFQDPSNPVHAEFRGVGGVWPYGGGAVSVGFLNPEDGPVLPTVPDDDPHRTTPPRWLTHPD
jgi:hypothetical protein